MEKAKYVKTAMWFAALYVFCTGFAAFPDTIQKTYAMSISDEDMEAALEEEFGQLSNDDYDMDIEQFADIYLEKLESGEVKLGDYEGEIIKNPDLQMEVTEDGKVRYILPGGDYYDANVPNGMITSSPVTLKPSAEVGVVVTKDGESSSIFNSWYFSEPGNYCVKMLFHRFASENVEDFQVYEVNHYFTIIGRKINSFGAVPAPDGFEIVSAKRDGVQLKPENPRCLFLEGDGFFEIRYRDIATGSIYAVTSFERDTIAPFLTFSCEIADGPVEGPVEFYKGDAADKVYLSYDGNYAQASDTVLKTDGRYTVSVIDEVGNSRSYELEIKRKYHIFDTKTIILAMIFFLGVGMRLLFLRKDMKVI